MALSPILLDFYYNSRQNRFVSPGLSLAISSNFGIIPLTSYFVVRINACLGYNFDPSSDGTVPSANRDTTAFASATGIPTFGIKLRTDVLSGSTSFAASVNGFNSTYTNLNQGQAAIGGIIPITVAGEQDYLAQVCLRDGATDLSKNIPSNWLPINLETPVVTGEETDSPSTVAYSGTATILAGTDNIPVSITNLTAATGVLATLTQQNGGNGLSEFWGVIADGLLTIYSAGNAPTGGYTIYYAMAHL